MENELRISGSFKGHEPLILIQNNVAIELWPSCANELIERLTKEKEAYDKRDEEIKANL